MSSPSDLPSATDGQNGPQQTESSPPHNGAGSSTESSQVRNSAFIAISNPVIASSLSKKRAFSDTKDRGHLDRPPDSSDENIPSNKMQISSSSLDLPVSLRQLKDNKSTSQTSLCDSIDNLQLHSAFSTESKAPLEPSKQLFHGSNDQKSPSPSLASTSADTSQNKHGGRQNTADAINNASQHATDNTSVALSVPTVTPPIIVGNTVNKPNANSNVTSIYINQISLTETTSVLKNKTTKSVSFTLPNGDQHVTHKPSVPLQILEKIPLPVSEEAPKRPEDLPRDFRLTGPVAQTFDVAAKAASHSAKAQVRADMLHNLRADLIFPIWATGVEPIPAHLKPESDDDLTNFLDLIKRQSLERVEMLEQALRHTAETKKESADFNTAIVNSTVTSEQAGHVAASIKFGVDRITYSVAKQATKQMETIFNRPPTNKELCESLFTAEHDSYQAHRAARGRGRSPSRPRSQSPGPSRRRSRSRSPRDNRGGSRNLNQGQGGRGRGHQRGNGQRGNNQRGRGNNNRGNGPTLAGLAAQLQQLSQRLSNNQ